MMELKTKDEMSYTDQIKEHLMEYIYSDDSVEDAEHLECIFKLLELMNSDIRSLQNDVDYYRKEMIYCKAELKRYKKNEEKES